MKDEVAMKLFLTKAVKYLTVSVLDRLRTLIFLRRETSETYKNLFKNASQVEYFLEGRLSQQYLKSN